MFYKEDVPTIISTRSIPTGELRTVRAGCNERFNLETGDWGVLTICLNGGWRIRHRSAGKLTTHTAQIGCTHLVRPGTKETITSEGSDAQIMQLKVSSPALDAVLQEDHDEARNFDALTTIDGQIDLQLTRVVAQAMLHSGGVRDVMVTMALAHLVGRYGTKTRPLVSRGLTPARLRRVKDLISSDLATVSLQAMAAEAGLSAFHFAREFKRDVGVTPWDYVVQQRLWAALNLLAGRHTASEAAKAVGFVDKSHLGRAVRRHLGASPGQAAAILYPG